MRFDWPGVPELVLDEPEPPLHQRQIDHHATVNRCASGNVVTASADRDFELLRPRELDGVDDIGEPRH